MENENLDSENINIISDNFKKIINNFIDDLNCSFEDEIGHEIKLLYEGSNLNFDSIYSYCSKLYPERFFDILYQNEDIFTTEEEIYFLPNINFSKIFKLDDLSDKNKESIWKYLQLILFDVVGDMDDAKSFGDTAKLFEAINANDFKTKLKESIENIQKSMSENTTFARDVSENNLPQFDSFQDHLQNMLGGKIGKLAVEIAEEAAMEYQQEFDFDESTDEKEVLNTILKNPTKIMDLVKKAGGKLDEKIQSGEIKKSELMQEASEMLNKVKEMPGMDNIGSMLGKMGMPGMGGGKGKGKFNEKAFKAHMDKAMKQEQTKERLRKKLDERKAQKNVEDELVKKRQEEYEKWIQENGGEDKINDLIFSLGEKPEKSERPQQVKKKKNNKKKSRK